VGCIPAGNPFYKQNITGERGSMRKKKEGILILPNNTHELPSHDRVTAIGADTEIKIGGNVRVVIQISHHHRPEIKVDRLNLVSKTDAHFGRLQHLRQEGLVQESTVN
jgi:hypothetical protein